MPNTAPSSARRPKAPNLFWQVVIATLLGIAFGIATPGLAANLHWATELFLRLILMTVGPLLFAIVVLGITGAGTLKTAGRLGAKALLYFEGMTTAALLGSMGLACLLHPGRGLNFTPTEADTHLIARYAANAHDMAHNGISGFLLGVIPKTPASAFTDGHVLQILFLAILIGCCLSTAGERAKPILTLIDATYALFSQIMKVVIALAPLGVFGAMATTTAAYGLAAIAHLAGFVLLYALAIAGFVGIVLSTCLALCGVPPLAFWRYFRSELLIVLTTTASDAVLPSLMTKLETLGVDKPVIGLVVPAGYSFNLDALSIYIGMGTIFLAEATNTPLHPIQLATLAAVALITSKGAHGVPGMGIVILAATLSASPSIPPASLVLLLAVDWFIGIARAGGNFCGNCVAPIVIAAWEGRLNRERLVAVLRG